MFFHQINFTWCLHTAGPGLVMKFGRSDKLKPPRFITQWGLSWSLWCVNLETPSTPCHLSKFTHHVRNSLKVLAWSLLPSHWSIYSLKHPFSHKLASKYFHFAAGEETIHSESQKKSVLKPKFPAVESSSYIGFFPSILVRTKVLSLEFNHFHRATFTFLTLILLGHPGGLTPMCAQLKAGWQS